MPNTYHNIFSTNHFNFANCMNHNSIKRFVVAALCFAAVAVSYSCGI